MRTPAKVIAVTAALLILAGFHATQAGAPLQSSRTEAFAAVKELAAFDYSTDLTQGTRELAEQASSQAVGEVTYALGVDLPPVRISFLDHDEFDVVAKRFFPAQYRRVVGLWISDEETESRIHIRAGSPNMAETVKHELFHAVWCEATDCQLMPRWLVEGTAIAFSEGLYREGLYDSAEITPVGHSAWWNLPNKGFMGPHHPGDPHAVGKQVMTAIARDYGPDKLHTFLNRVIQQTSMAQGRHVA